MTRKQRIPAKSPVLNMIKHLSLIKLRVAWYYFNVQEFVMGENSQVFVLSKNVFLYTSYRAIMNRTWNSMSISASDCMRSICKGEICLKERTTLLWTIRDCKSLQWLQYRLLLKKIRTKKLCFCKNLATYALWNAFKMLKHKNLTIT